MALGWLVCGGSVGCLVTDQIEFDTDCNVPPMIIDVPSPVAAIDQIVWIDKSTTKMFSLAVKVRDENITEPLQAHWRIVSKEDPLPRFETVAITVSGDELRDLSIDVQTAFVARWRVCAASTSRSAARFGSRPIRSTSRSPRTTTTAT